MSTDKKDRDTYEAGNYDERELVTFRIEEEDLEAVDGLVDEGIFETRTEAICYSIEHHLEPREVSPDYELLERKGYEMMEKLEEQGKQDSEMYFHLGKHLGMVEVLSQLD